MRLVECQILSKCDYTVYIILYYVHVFPLVPSRILWISPNQTAELGKEITLVCKVTGRPSPRVVWKRNGTVLQDSAGTVDITLVNISPSDRGAYECSAINIVANNTRTTLLNVIGWHFASRDITYGTLDRKFTYLSVKFVLAPLLRDPVFKHSEYRQSLKMMFYFYRIPEGHRH